MSEMSQISDMLETVPETQPSGRLARLWACWGALFLAAITRSALICTFSSYSKSFFLLPYIGYVFGMNLANNPADLTVFAGPRIERRKIKLRTDQGTFGGVSEFSNSETDIGVTVGVDLDIPLPALFNADYAGGSVPFVRLGAAWDWSPSIEVSGTSTGVPFDYNNRIKSGGAFRFFVGGGIKW